ncbi:terminase large subunit [Leuconostoc falkenbergense]|uniref:terminase large subunit n=1 Tax=Leuconostoc falkenbergense TaxID=2766470 RepID=UPI0021AABA1E|nr:terminase TerL endonuclease subunit [Leuconostoc falkenbergense]MCT4418889.1 terminase large subunit [Leuconostoc falkenbergense]
MKKIDLTQSKDVLGAYQLDDYSEIRKKYQDSGTRYAFRVLDGEQIAGYKIKLASLRHVRDLMRSENNDPEFPYRYDLKQVKAILYFASLCPDVDAGKPLPLMAWEEFILSQLNGWRDSSGDKRFTEADISVARKQGKTYFAAIISAYSFLIEGATLGNQDYLVASNSSDQIDKLYGYVKYMITDLINNNKAFKKMASARGIEAQERKIVAKKPNNRLVKISNESGKFDGYHFTSAIYDEAGDEKAGKYTSRIITGQTDVKNHQFIKISTAYEFLNTEFFNDLKRGVESMEKDWSREYDNSLWLVWSQDSENEMFEPRTWEKSNPLIGLPNKKASITKGITNLRETLAAKGKIAEFQNKTMNIYLQVSQASFLKLKDVERAITAKFEIYGKQVYIGYDYSMFSDNTAIAFVYPYLDSRGKRHWHVEQHSFIPWEKAGSIEAKEKQDGINYRELAKQGYCTITSHPQGLINDDQVYQWLLNYVEDNALEVVFFGYDAWGATPAIKQLELNTSWNLMAIRQRTSELKDPTKFLQSAFVESSITRLDDKIMEKALLNAQVIEDKIGIQVDKAKATLKIDVVDAIIDALYQGMIHFEDYSDVNDPEKQIERMTPQQKLDWLLSDEAGLMGDEL